MDKPSNKIENLFHSTEEYARTSFELLKLKTLDKSSEVVSSVILRLLMMCVLLISLLILSIGVSFWLGSLLEKNYYGFFLVGLFWAVIGIVLYIFFGNAIKKFFTDDIIRKAL